MPVSTVFRICTAYESGYGNGLSGNDGGNPYPIGINEYEAYEIGYAAGIKAKEELFGVELSGKD